MKQARQAMNFAKPGPKSTKVCSSTKLSTIGSGNKQAPDMRVEIFFLVLFFNFFLLLMLLRVLALGCRNCESHHLFLSFCLRIFLLRNYIFVVHEISIKCF